MPMAGGLDTLPKGAFKRYYDQRLYRMMRFNVPRGSKVLEIGCSTGELLSALDPALGVGIDVSKEAVQEAARRYPHLKFIAADAGDLPITGHFDAIIMSNLVGELDDVQSILEALHPLCGPETRIFISYFNYLWEPAIKLAELLGLKRRQPEQNWLRPKDLENLLQLAGFETVKATRDLLLPVPVPLAADLVNDYVAPMPFLNLLCVNELVVGRKPFQRKRDSLSASVVVACKDEKGNIEEIVRCVPKMGAWTELLFVDGHSTDGTVEAVRTVARRHLRAGTTSFLATTGSAPLSHIWKSFDCIREVMHAPYSNEARVLGIHMEGPFFSLSQRGAHAPELLRMPNAEEKEKLYSYVPELVRLSIAPEREGALEIISHLSSEGVLISGAHSDALYEQVCLAMEAGMRHITHLWSGMSMVRRIGPKR